jgi:hypothetical protein
MRRIWLFAILLTLLLAGLACARSAQANTLPAAISPGAECRSAIAAAEREKGIPSRLLAAIGVIESGRAETPGATPSAWPWTINVEGVGYVFPSKGEALAAVRGHQARGARSIDVGCMQINLMYHPNAFSSLEEAFDPATNARYAARFLAQLRDQTGSWEKATAGYHSLTPGIGDDYARKVQAALPRQQQLPAEPEPSSPAGGGTFTPNRGLSFAGAGAPARIIPIAGAAGMGGGFTGRSLDSYRVAPTRMASR